MKNETEFAPTPAEIGLPRPSWRAGQWDMVWNISQMEEGEQGILNAPTGFGKSLTYMGVQALSGWRVVILTETKALQDQLMREFGQEDRNEEDRDAGALIDVRGQSNYTCNASLDQSNSLGMFFRRGKRYTVRDAPCRRGIQCQLRDGGCSYYDRIRQAARSQMFVTNYDFWFHNQGKMGKVDLLVLDEAHSAPGALADFLSFKLEKSDRKLLNAEWPQGVEVKEWVAWAEWAHQRVTELIERDGHDEKLGDLRQTLDRMMDTLPRGEWVVEHTPQGVSFDCIDSENHGRKWLWGCAKRTLLVSATVNLMTATGLGMQKSAVRTWEAKSAFPLERRPVYVIQGAVRLNFRSTEGEKRMWLSLIDRVIDSRKDRKGIIHTTSFERAQYFALHSRHKSMLFLNASGSTGQTVQRFISAPGGAVLVSPSVTTGWDFPMSSCEYQIIAKIPFPDLRTLAAKEKNKRNKLWSGYTAAQTIVQAAGRGMRSADDQCETFIVDGNFDWWWGQNKQFLPEWFSVALKWVGLSTLPAPPPKL